jgi:hypothetical protein
MQANRVHFPYAAFEGVERVVPNALFDFRALKAR